MVGNTSLTRTVTEPFFCHLGPDLVHAAAGRIRVDRGERLQVLLDQIGRHLVVVIEEEDELTRGGLEPCVPGRALPRALQCVDIHMKVGSKVREIVAASLDRCLIHDDHLLGAHGLIGQLHQQALEVRVSVDGGDEHGYSVVPLARVDGGRYALGFVFDGWPPRSACCHAGSTQPGPDRPPSVPHDPEQRPGDPWASMVKGDDSQLVGKRRR